MSAAGADTERRSPQDATTPGPGLRELVEDGRVHVLDGAMGTLLYGRGVFVNVCYDELNVDRPELVRSLHGEYVKAGAEVLETNTFGANPVKLSSWGLEDRTEELNAAAARLAREAADGRALVVGALGPLGIRIEPFGPTGRGEAEGYFGRQVDGLLAGGVDGFCLETFSDLAELETAYRAVRARSGLPVIAQVTVGEDGRTSYGTDAEVVAATLAEWGVEVIGLNCSVGPAPMLEAVERMARATDRPLAVQPNAGLPRTVRDRKIYMASPEYMALYARRMIEAGARFVGGCCGTTPEHVRQIKATVASLQPRHPTVRVDVSDGGERRLGSVPLRSRSPLGTALAGGDFVRIVELMPPRGWETGPLVEAARRARDAGAEAVAVVDSPRARSRMGSIPAALVLQREVGVETLVHYTCRDRNMMGMISDLLGAAGAGLRNLLVVSGDPPVEGPFADSEVVFDIDSIGLVNVLRGLNHGLDPGGNAIGAPTPFVVGVAGNQGAVDLEREVQRFRYKVEAGADFVVTQPVFDAADLERFLERTAAWRVPVVASLWPLTSLRNAEFLANEVPGVRVPPSVLERMRGAQEGGAAAARAEGLKLALEVRDAVRPLVQGIQVATPGGEVERALVVLG